ncbi:hypothetical protein T09_13600 [Trichinella sp. T9]|nr:hypothetical protein T09_13600 [Trichinella sp. T9]
MLLWLRASLFVIRNHVDKYVITKHYHQLMPLSLATSGFRESVKGIMAKLSQPQALPSGYAPGQIKICICLQAIPQAIYSTIFDLRGFLCKFLIASGPRRRLRLCPRANKNLHIPAGYFLDILLPNICLQGVMQIFRRPEFQISTRLPTSAIQYLPTYDAA